MTDMLRQDQVRMLSPENRVKNGYESLYYGTPSGDPEMDAIMREQIQRSFQTHDVSLTDKPSGAMLDSVMRHACAESVREAQGVDLLPVQDQLITEAYNEFSSTHQRFHERTYTSFVTRYQGDTVDALTEEDRFMREVGEEAPMPTEAQFDDMQTDYALGQMQRFQVVPGATAVPEAPAPESSMSYAGTVPEAPTLRKAPPRTYAQAREAEAVATEIKGQSFNVSYDAYAKTKQTNHSEFSAGDDYGFDEHEPEDDGPEL